MLGRFTIDIPYHWRCVEEDRKSGNPVSFVPEDYPDCCFQISCYSVLQGSVPDLIARRNFAKNEYFESEISFLEREIVGGDMRIIMREAVVGEHFILASYIASQKEDDPENIKNLQQLDCSLTTLTVGNQSSWIQGVAHARFDKFMVSLLASVDLMNRAIDNGSSIELVIIYANQIDALLRLSLILEKQLKDSSKEIDISLIFQGEKDRPILEKAIYKQSLDDDVIDQVMFDKLQKLYDSRNKVVHRYIISDLKTNDIVNLVVGYMDIRSVLGKKIAALENEQYKRKIGIYGNESNPTDSINTSQMKHLLAELHRKHDNAQVVKESTIKIPVNDTLPFHEMD